MATLICSVDEGVLNYKVHVAFSVSPDPYPSGATVGSYGKTLKNVKNNATVTIKASETTCRSNYTFPVDVYTSTDGVTWGKRIDYLQSGQVTFSAGSGTKYVKVGPATKGSSGESYTLTAGSFPEVLSQVKFSDGTSLTSDGDSCAFSKSKIISSISMSSSGSKWYGTIYWSASSSGTKFAIADVANGVVTLRDTIETIDFNNKSRTIYFTAVTATIYYLTAGGTFPTYVKEIKFSDGTSFTVSNKSIVFTSSKTIKSITLTDPAINGKWTGRLYWSSTAGAKTYLIASINKGVVSMASSIETIDFNGASRTIYFTEDGGYPYRTVHLRLSNGVDECKISYTDVDTHTTSSLWLDNTYKTIKAETGYSISISSTTYKSINSQNCRNAAFEKWNYDGTFASHLDSASYSVTGAATDGDIYLRVGAETPIGFYTNGGLWSDNRSSQPKFYWRRIYAELDLSDPSGMITRDRYAVLGWAKTADSTSPSYGKTETLTIGINGPFTLYAVWQMTEAIITFYGNGGVWYGNLQYKQKTYNVGDEVLFADYSKDLARAGYSLLGWSTSKTATTAPWATDGHVTVGATDAEYYAVWGKKNIDLFYWNTAGTDAALFAKGQPISNLTAARWNKLKAKIRELAIASGSAYPYTEVSKGDSITADEFNAVRTAISNRTGHGTLPAAQKKGNTILASLFEGNTSLKSALNEAITYYNDN